MIQGIKNIYHFFSALLAILVFRYPARQLTVIGVTGTDGKTTTVNLIYHILITSGKKVSLISSVNALISKKQYDTGFHVTTPNPWALQKYLRQAVDKGCQFMVLEATSHGLDQHRLLGSNFALGVVTNVTHEHLDYHKTYQNYLKAKAKLFRGVKLAILNQDDKSFTYLKSVVPKKAKLITYGLKKGDFTPRTFKFKTSLPGEYNQYNCLAAIAVTSCLGLSNKIIKKGVSSFESIKGRLEEIDEDQDFKVFVDFAHTPNALESVLKFLEEKKEGKLIVVFGCAGERDRAKRPVMGEISARLTDITVLTAEDPRTEDVNEIISQIARGCKKAGGIEGKTFFKVPDRAEAIKFAFKKAKEGDIVILCGKGHEKSMCFEKTEYPWSDQETARKALRKIK